MSVLPLSHQELTGAKRCNALARAAATVRDAVGAGRMPGHADHLRPVVAVVGRHQETDVVRKALMFRLHGLQVERLEGLGVVEVSPSGLAAGGS